MKVYKVLLLIVVFIINMGTLFAESDGVSVTVTGYSEVGDLSEAIAIEIAHDDARAKAIVKGGTRIIQRISKMDDFELVKDVIVSQVDGLITDEVYIDDGIRSDGRAFYRLRAIVKTGKLDNGVAEIQAVLKSRGKPKIAVRILRNELSYSDSGSDKPVDEDAENVIKIDYEDGEVLNNGKRTSRRITGKVKFPVSGGVNKNNNEYRSEAEKILRSMFSSYLQERGFDLYDEIKLAAGRKKESGYFAEKGRGRGSKIKGYNEADYVITGSVYISDPIYLEEDGVHLVRYSYSMVFDFTNVVTGEKVPGIVFPPTDLAGELTKAVPLSNNFDAIKDNIHAAGAIMTKTLIGKIVSSWSRTKPLIRVNLVNLTDDEFYDLYDGLVDKFPELDGEVTDFFNNGEGILEIRTDVRLNTLRRFLKKQKIVQLEMVHKGNNTISFVKKDI